MPIEIYHAHHLSYPPKKDRQNTQVYLIISKKRERKKKLITRETEGAEHNKSDKPTPNNKRKNVRACHIHVSFQQKDRQNTRREKIKLYNSTTKQTKRD